MVRGTLRPKKSFLTPAQAAVELGISRSMVYYHVSKGNIDSYKVQGTDRILLDKADVDTLRRQVRVIKNGAVH